MRSGFFFFSFFGKIDFVVKKIELDDPQDFLPLPEHTTVADRR